MQSFRLNPILACSILTESKKPSSDGVALAHAGKDDGVRKACLSLLVSKEGIHFTESNQRVHLLFFFASLGGEDDLDVLRAIIQIGQKPGEALRIASLADAEQMYEALIL